MTEGHDSRNPGLASWILILMEPIPAGCVQVIWSLCWPNFSMPKGIPDMLYEGMMAKLVLSQPILLFSFIDLSSKQHLERGGHLTPLELTH